MKFRLILFFCLAGFTVSSAQHPDTHPIPDWLIEKWKTQTHQGGIWITDNSRYRSEQEPYDAYGIQWEYGLGKKHLKGRLYCIKSDKDVGTIWDFTEFWDPREGVVRIVQIGSNGMLGQGTMWKETDGSIKEQQQFVGPDGGSFVSGHHSWMEDGAHHTQSFNIIDDQWEKRRYYVWKQPSAEQPVTGITSDFDFLMGEWTVKARRLKQRLSASNEWLEYDASCKFWKQLDGRVVMDEFRSVENGKEQLSSTYRIYNPNTEEWTIYWASTAFPDLGLIPQVKGSFQDGVGTFYGEEEFRGEKVQLRFIWKQPTRGTAYWEQAYYDVKREAWETNWTMEFTKP